MNKNIENIKKCRMRSRTARKIKITVINESKRKVALPGIPFWLLEKLVSIALVIFRISQTGKKRKIHISEKEMFEIIGELKKEPPFTMVEVTDKKGNFVEIKTV